MPQFPRSAYQLLKGYINIAATARDVQSVMRHGVLIGCESGVPDIPRNGVQASPFNLSLISSNSMVVSSSIAFPYDTVSVTIVT